MRRSLSCVVLAAGLLAGSAWGLSQEPASRPATSPVRVTLNLDNVSAQEAFDHLARQVGIDLIVDDPNIFAQADLVSLNVKDAPFWPTFIKLCQSSGLSFDQGNNYGQTRVRSIRLAKFGNGENPLSRRPMAEAEGFVLMATGAQRNYNINYEAAGNSSSSFWVQLMVLPEPGLHVVSISQPTLSEAVDENGLSLLPTGNNSMSYGNQPNQFIQQAALSLSYPSKGGRKVARLKGQLQATALVRAEKIEIDNPLTAKPVTKDLPDYVVVISPLKRVNQNYQVKVTFRAKKNPQATGGVRRGATRDYWSLANTIELTDADGRRYGNGGSSGGGGNAGSYECTMNYSPQGNAVGAPTKLSWNLPAETKEIVVPFEMKDLPIP